MARDVSNLSLVEISTYSFIWVATVCYGIYKVYLVGSYFQHDSYSEDFLPGWFLGRQKDVSDYEWSIWIPLIVRIAPWCAVHLVGSELCRWLNVKLLPVWYVLLPSVFLVRTFGPAGAATLLLQPLVFALIARHSRSRWLTWATSLAILALLNTHPLTQAWFGFPHHLSYMLSVGQSWVHLRCLSFCLDMQGGAPNTSPLHLLAYCLYLPLSLLGPLVLFSDFRQSLDRGFTPWTPLRCLSLLLGVSRYVFWLLVNEVWLHLVYSSALSFQPDLVARLDAPTLYGLGYCLGQFFMTKYTVVYGLPGTLARAEGVPAPGPPKCIGRIHLYSDMWRTFDQGLYNFLARYIYIPISGGGQQLWRRAFASLVCFVFVYLWHGTMTYILVWSLLNYLGVTLEVVARKVAATTTFKTWQARRLGPRAVRRFNALLTCPLLFMSALSNFYFFAGLEVGNVFVARAWQGPGSSLVMLGLLYCCCHVSEEVKRWEGRRRPSVDKNCLQ